MDIVKFSTYQLIIDEKEPNINDIASKLRNIIGSDPYEQNGIYYYFEYNFCKNKQYLWLYANYGKPNPRPNFLRDIETGGEAENQRQKTQIEPNGQLFMLYSQALQTLYISDARKKSFVAEFLGRCLERDVSIKSRFLPIDQFIEKIISFEEVRFTGTQNLFNRNGHLFNNLGNLFGFGAPKKFAIVAEYRERISESVKRKIRDIAGISRAHDLESLTMIGKDESGFEAIYNVSEFVQKLEFKIEKDEQGLLNAQKVLEELLQSLEKVQGIINVQAA